MSDRSDEIRKKLQEIEQERETIERVKKRVIKQEGWVMNLTNPQLQSGYLKECLHQWRGDDMMQKMYYEQVEIFAEEIQSRKNMMEEWEVSMARYRQQLYQSEKEYLVELAEIENKEAAAVSESEEELLNKNIKETASENKI
jgi:hypothetical protein